MKAKITFLNGESLVIDQDTHLTAWSSEDNSNVPRFFAGKTFDGTYAEVRPDAPRLGLKGLLGASNFFTVGEDNDTFYSSSSVFKIELVEE